MTIQTNIIEYKNYGVYSRAVSFKRRNAKVKQTKKTQYIDLFHFKLGIQTSKRRNAKVKQTKKTQYIDLFHFKLLEFS